MLTTITITLSVLYSRWVYKKSLSDLSGEFYALQKDLVPHLSLGGFPGHLPAPGGSYLTGHMAP